MTSSTGSDVCGTQNDAKKIQIQIIPIKKEFTRTMPQQSNAFSYESISGSQTQLFCHYMYLQVIISSSSRILKQ